MEKFCGLAAEGGGVAGFNYLGALKQLAQNIPLEQFTVFSGSSAGAITMAMLSVRTTLAQMDKILSATDFKKFKDNSWFFIKDLIDLDRKYGWYNGNYLLEWIRQAMHIVTGNADITFLEAHQQYKTTLTITKVAVLKPLWQLITMDYVSHPNHSIALACRESASLPIFYEAVPGKNLEAGHMFVDGGTLLNYPIEFLYRWLPPAECIGLYLLGDNDNAGEDNLLTASPVSSFIEYGESFIATLRNLAMKRHINNDDWKRTCKIKTHVSAVQFNFTEAERAQCIVDGATAMKEFLESLNVKIETS